MTTALAINTRPNSLPAYAYAGLVEQVLGTKTVHKFAVRFWEPFILTASVTFIVLLEILTA